VTAGRVLVVDDEPQIRRSLRVTLRANGYDVDEAVSGEDALDKASVHPPLLVILDLTLPDMSGVEVTRRLREWTRLPIVVLSVRGDDDAKVQALDAGADDYITKPFSVPELLARMRVALRHSAVGVGDAGGGVLVSGDVIIDLVRRVVRRAGSEVHLTPTEYGLLRFLAQNAGRVVTHGQLLRAVMGTGYEDAVGSLRVFIASLRKKLEADPSEPCLIVTEPGVGYRLKAD
jgi:two-component system, OmpR family, KDP operon response regulator KdpE